MENKKKRSVKKRHLIRAINGTDRRHGSNARESDIPIVRRSKRMNEAEQEQRVQQN